MSNPEDLRLLAERMFVTAIVDLGQPAHSGQVKNRRRLTVMKQRERFLAKLSAACVLLLGTTGMNFAWAAKTAPASHHSDRGSTRHGNAPAPATSHSAPAPVTLHSAPAPVTSHAAPAPVTRSEHGEVGGAAKSEWGPIDTRITV
jgi:hypothetical protein